MGSPGSAVETPGRTGAPLAGYGRLPGAVPVLHPPRLEDRALELRGYLEEGSGALVEILGVEEPRLVASLVADDDWDLTPRENRRPYPTGLPYFTRSTDPPSLVLPERLAPVFGPRTGMLLPLTVWHELAHAFLLDREVVKMPAWLGELAPQTASAAVARRVGAPLERHLDLTDRDPGFTVRGFGDGAGAEDQMKFQNLLLGLGAAALEEFGEDFLGRLFGALWQEDDVIDAGRAEDLLAGALGPGGGNWLRSRPEFGEE